MTKQISLKQREFLATIAQNEQPTDDFPGGLPLYLSHTFMEFRFNTASERQRWYENLEKRGLITLTGNGKCFARLTDTGRMAVKQKAIPLTLKTHNLPQHHSSRASICRGPTLPMPYPTDGQVDAVYQQAMGQTLREQDAAAVRRFGRAMFLCAWNSATQAAPVAPAPQPAGFVLVPVEPTPEMLSAAYSGPIQGGLEAVYANMLAAAPKAAPQPITEAEQAAWHAGLDEGRSQARVPLQQGEYPVWPEPAIFDGVDRSGNPVSHSYSATQVNELLDAARGAAQAAPDNRVPEAWTNLLAYALQDDMHNRLTPRVVDIAYTAFMQAKRPNEDGGASDWFNDTKPKVAEMIAKLRKDLIEERAAAPAPVAEDAEIRKALHDAATSLETISRIAGRDKDMLGMMDVRLYAASRARVAREAQAAQPEGGAYANS